ncbi:MAG: carboxymuconolactone decarboxylase family protein [Pelagimonas sp.]|uniref:carboxymuconolactone decarboxylase family protein n=1 Tax=Pelagimonas sp. TaxID=2073170 RepID=UPI003D6C60F7
MPAQVEPIDLTEWDSSLSSVADDMNGAPLNVHKLMAHNPSLLNAWWNFRNYSVNGGSLGPRLGELVILRVGIQLGAWYEWGSHVDRSLRCGLTHSEINAVLERNIAPLWSPQDALLLQAVDELIGEHQISAGTLTKLESHFDTAQIMDIMAIHGMYVILGCMIKTWGLRLDDTVNDRIKSHTTQSDFEAAATVFRQVKNVK